MKAKSFAELVSSRFAQLRNTTNLRGHPLTPIAIVNCGRHRWWAGSSAAQKNKKTKIVGSAKQQRYNNRRNKLQSFSKTARSDPPLEVHAMCRYDWLAETRHLLRTFFHKYSRVTIGSVCINGMYQYSITVNSIGISNTMTCRLEYVHHDVSWHFLSSVLKLPVELFSRHIPDLPI